MRTFETGATRDVCEDKYDYEGFNSPAVMNLFAQYMHTHRVQEDGALRASDNWQAGIPDKAYLKSMYRHFIDVWSIMRGYQCQDIRTGEYITLPTALCALKFNVDGLLFNVAQKQHMIIRHGELPLKLSEKQ
jgi:hypothetical protein